MQKIAGLEGQFEVKGALGHRCQVSGARFQTPTKDDGQTLMPFPLLALNSYPLNFKDEGASGDIYENKGWAEVRCQMSGFRCQVPDLQGGPMGRLANHSDSLLLAPIS